VFGSEGADFCSGRVERILKKNTANSHRLEKVEGIGVGAYDTELPREFQITYMAIKVKRQILVAVVG